MRLGIPTLCRYDLLEELLLSAECGSVVPSSYIIVDNGGGFERARLDSLLGHRAARVTLLRPGENIGVAASWNVMLDFGLEDDEPIVVSNDDVVFGKNLFGELVRASKSHAIFGNDHSLFVQSPECTRRVGYYDENFWPAYYEDSDYSVRLYRAGITRGTGLSYYMHHGHASSPGSDGRGSAENRLYFRTKWNGRMLGEDPLESFDEPWGGQTPIGWRLRNPPRDWFAWFQEMYGRSAP